MSPFRPSYDVGLITLPHPLLRPYGDWSDAFAQKQPQKKQTQAQAATIARGALPREQKRTELPMVVGSNQASATKVLFPF
jgi:hypothetical protein